MSDTIEVFISYSKQDKELRDGLLAHMRPLEREGIITWHDRQILPGTEWDEEIKARLNAADIILLLISADFLATDYCTQVEIPEALRRHEAGEATVMPVILRSCGWKYTPLAKIQAYPEKAKPVVSWTYIDEAYTNVVDGVYLAATKIKEQRSQQAEQEQLQKEPQQAEEQEWERSCQAEPLRQHFTTEEESLKQKALERKQQEQLHQEVERRGQQTQANKQKLPPDAVRGDYAQLEALLQTGKWKEADGETAKQMCEVMGRQHKGGLSVEDIKHFPSEDLRMIDQLWSKYSNGKFGFTTQKRILQRYNGSGDQKKKDFGVAVGWKNKGFLGVGTEWKRYDMFTFDISAPPGHLPFRFTYFFGHVKCVWCTQSFWDHRIALFSRADL